MDQLVVARYEQRIPDPQLVVRLEHSGGDSKTVHENRRLPLDNVQHEAAARRRESAAWSAACGWAAGIGNRDAVGECEGSTCQRTVGGDELHSARPTGL